MVLAEPEVWYGWQSLIGVSASLTTGLASSIFGVSGMVFSWPAGLGGTVFSGPIVHWAHGRVGRGFAVLAMNIGGAGLGLAVGGLPVACAIEECDGFYLTYGIVGSYVGATIGAVIDIALLSKYKAPPRPIATRPSVLDSVVPVVDLRAGRAVFGLGGVF